MQRDICTDSAHNHFRQCDTHSGDRLLAIIASASHAITLPIGNRSRAAPRNCCTHGSPHEFPAHLAEWYCVMRPADGVSLYGSSALIRHSIACPLSGVTSRCRRVSFSPAATRICACTRSMPLMASVTGCSTWRRVFISMEIEFVALKQELERTDATR